MTPDSFQEHYARLNPQQKEAVDTIDGPVMVVAGPGTGKTQILTLRIANILRQTDTRPENILALTFTEAGVAAMRRRLTEIIGAPAYRVTISTFHGFCNDIIKRYPDEFPHIISSQNITEVDQVRILEELIESLPLEHLRPYGDPLLYLRDVQRNVDTLKREGVSVEAFEKAVKQERKVFESKDDLYHQKGAHKGKMKGEYQKLQTKIAKNEEFARVYAAYQEKLAAEKLYDYSDMIMEVLGALQRNENLLLTLQEQYQYFLIDEHQDTNNAQNRIIELLCNFHENPNVFVVGDEKQAIYRFQGASLENFLYFKKLYPAARLVALEHNYRSTQAILDSAHSLLAGPAPLKANAPHENVKVCLYSFTRPEVEWYFVAQDIRKRLEAGTPAHEIAVLYRENRDAYAFATALEKSGVAYVVESNQDVLRDRDIRKLILLLRAVNDFGAQDTLIAAMHVDFLGIAPLDIFKITEYASRNKTSVHDIVRSKEILDSLNLETAPSIQEFFAKLSSWAIRCKNVDFTPFLEQVLEESGYLSHIISTPDAVERIDKLMGLYEEVRKLVEAHRDCSIREFFQYIDTLQAHHVSIRKSVSSHPQGHVRLMTAHGSKGQEFDYVYIVQASDGHWGNKWQRNRLPLPARIFALVEHEIEEDDENADERRLFYVALTRARRGVNISYAKQGTTGYEQLPSQFIQEIDPGLLHQGESEPYETGWNKNREMFLAPIKKGMGTAGVKDKEFVREIFLRNGLSASSLNSYLECPWKYFYENLLRIPRSKTKFEMYGTAAHAALQDLFEAIKAHAAGNVLEDAGEKKGSSGMPDVDFLLKKFVFHLRRQPISSRDLEELEAKGQAALKGYWEHYHAQWSPNVLTEFSVPAVMLTPELRLTGKIDKVEFVSDSGEVNVVDYKTGKPKTRGQIEGTTKDSKGNYKRQLVFYNLLLNHFEDGKYRMVSGEIDFLEPNERGIYKKEKFEIAPEEIRELEDTAKRVADEIMNLAFWDERCDEKDCEFCALRAMMG